MWHTTCDGDCSEGGEVVKWRGLVALALGTLWLWRTQRAFLVWYAVLVAYVVVLPGPILYERFTLPIVPLLCVGIGCGVQHGLVTLVSRRVTKLKPK